MSADESALSTREEARVQAVLREDEQLALVVKPSATVHKGWASLMVLSGMLILWLLLRGCIALQEYCWVLILCGVPVWAAAVLLCISPLWHKRRMARTLYVLTDRRALVLEPVELRQERVVSFPLQADLVLKLQKRAGGYGDMIFAWERRWCPGMRVFSPMQPVGFLALPQVERVAQMLAEQVETVTPEASLLPIEGMQPLPVDKRGRPRFATGVHELIFRAGQIACGLSCLFLLIGASSLPREIRFGLNAETTHATILSLRKEVSFWNSPRSERERIRTGRHAGRSQYASYYPTIRYTDEKGRAYTTELPTPLDPHKFSPGEKLIVRYDRRTPQEVVPGRNSRSGILFCFLSCVSYIVGGCFIAAGLMQKTGS